MSLRVDRELVWSLRDADEDERAGIALLGDPCCECVRPLAGVAVIASERRAFSPVDCGARDVEAVPGRLATLSCTLAMALRPRWGRVGPSLSGAVTSWTLSAPGCSSVAQPANVSQAADGAEKRPSPEAANEEEELCSRDCRAMRVTAQTPGLAARQCSVPLEGNARRLPDLSLRKHVCRFSSCRLGVD